MSRGSRRLANVVLPGALADALGITLNTLKSDVRDMLRRTGFASRQALVKAVLREPAPTAVALV